MSLVSHFKHLGPAIEALKIDLDTVVTNEPINRKRGDLPQANLEKRNAKSYRAAIDLIGKAIKRKGEK
jgi:hypothetical protein